MSPPPDIPMPPCLEALKDGILNLDDLPDCAKENLKMVKKSLSKLYNSLPKSLTNKLKILYTELIKHNININHMDPEFTRTLFDVLADSEENTINHVHKYIEKKKQQGEL